MSYDMRDFLVSCVDKYCELAKVSRSSLKHVSTPFHENRIAKPTSDNEPQGHCGTLAANRKQSPDEDFVCSKDG